MQFEQAKLLQYKQREFPSKKCLKTFKSTLGWWRILFPRVYRNVTKNCIA